MAVRMKTRRITASLTRGRKVILPAWELDGERVGPSLLLVAAQHGNEVQATEVIRRFIEIVARGKLNGKVFAVPFGNLPAVRERHPHIRMGPTQHYRDDRGHNMNRTWPGNPRGNDTARVSYAIYRAFGEQATHCLDFHCWEEFAAPALLMRQAPGFPELARKIGHRFVHICRPADRTLGGYFCSTGRIGMTFECSGQYEVNKEQVKLGLRVLMNFAKAIRLVPGRLQKGYDPVLFSDQIESSDIAAPCSGLFVAADLKLCDYVRKGTVLGHILSDITLQCRELRAPRAGYLRAFGASRAKTDVTFASHHPYVSRGERLAMIVWSRNG